MKHLTRAKHIVLALLILTIILVIFMQIKYQGAVAVIYAIFVDGGDIAQDYMVPTLVTLVSLAQCANLSIALYILSILDKHLMPVYS